MSELLQQAREFWFNNVPGSLYGTSRQEMAVHGGPAPELNACQICQKSEWISRSRQENLFVEHQCELSSHAKALCQKQGDELWTHYHQNFWFAVGCDPALDAPKCACLFLDEPAARLYERYWSYHPDQWMIDLRRQLGWACQVDVLKSPDGVDWSQYDLLFFQNAGNMPLFPRPDIPIVMYGHDTHKRDGRDPQPVFDHFRPEVFLTPVPTSWEAQYRIPEETKVWFGPLAASSYYTRPNVHGKKWWDLLVVGCLAHDLYAPRKALADQICPLADRWRIEFSHHAGCQCTRYEGPVEFQGVRYLNKWSEYLGQARVVTFGPIAPPCDQYVSMKYYECLGSGAVSIMPQVQDLGRLGVMDRVHYIPLSEIWENNRQLEQILSRYGEYQQIAERAVEWHEQNIDHFLFDEFGELVESVTGGRYPRRLVQ